MFTFLDVELRYLVVIRIDFLNNCLHIFFRVKSIAFRNDKGVSLYELETVSFTCVKKTFLEVFKAEKILENRFQHNLLSKKFESLSKLKKVSLILFTFSSGELSSLVVNRAETNIRR